MSELDRVRVLIRAAAREAVVMAAHDLGGRAARDAPIREGALRASVDYEEDETAFGFQVMVVFRELYAEIQETRVDFDHPKGGKARYLGDNVESMKSSYERVIAAAIARVV